LVKAIGCNVALDLEEVLTMSAGGSG